MNARARGLAKGAVLLGMLAGFVAINAPAQAGSDSPTPYTVSADGITLPAGTVFPAHGHVNWRTTWAQHGIHLDPNNGHHGAKYIGASFIPFNLEPGECITWVQVSLYDEHYGEGGQAPICRDAETEPPAEPEPTPTTPTPEPTEEPTWTPEPTDTPTTAAPSDEPSTTPSSEPTEPSTTTPPSETPSEQPSETPTPHETNGSTPPKPSTPQPEPSETPDPTEPPTPPAPIECDPGYAPGWLDEHGNPTGCVANGPTEPEPEETPWTTPTETPSSQPSNAPNSVPGTPTASSVPSTETEPKKPAELGAPQTLDWKTPPLPSLAATGSNDTLIWTVTALVAVLLGAHLYLTNHRRKP